MSADTSNATLTAGVDSLRLRVAGAIKQAASASGASFEYLLTTAKMESDFNPTAGASTSSAHGLFQFIDQTWLGTVKEAGPQLGYGNYAAMITRNSDGSYSVADSGARKAIMKLRDDPAVASAMAGALTQSNSFKLTGMLGRRPSDAELYMAHFMGVGGAAKLIANAEDNPQASAARMFPNAASANRSIFYERSTGRARSVSEVYSVLEARYASAANASSTRNAMAAVGGIKPTTAVASLNATTSPPAVDKPSYLSTFPTRAVASVAAPVTSAALPASTTTTTVVPAAPITVASASPPPTSAPPPTNPIFRSLFQDDGARPQPVSQKVRELWGSRTASLTSDLPAASATTASPAAPARATGGLDLFSDPNGTFSGQG